MELELFDIRCHFVNHRDFESDDAIWIGLHDRINENDFIWEDGTHLDTSGYTHWAPHQGQSPNHTSHHLEDCVAMLVDDDGEWHDCACTTPSDIDKPLTYMHAFLCQYPTSQSGVPGGNQQTTAMQTAVPVVPTGMPGSSYTINNCPPGIPRDGNLQVHDSIWYQFVLEKPTYYLNAERSCESHGGTLVLVKSQEINDYLVDTLVDVYNNR